MNFATQLRETAQQIVKKRVDQNRVDHVADKKLQILLLISEIERTRATCLEAAKKGLFRTEVTVDGLLRHDICRALRTEGFEADIVSENTHKIIQISWSKDANSRPQSD